MYEIKYPFHPKSTAKLMPGQFWAIPLSNGDFACGRVLQLMPHGEAGSRSGFLAGLLDWCSPKLPDEISIAKAKCLAQGSMHIKAINTSFGGILGYRDLSLDDIQPWTFRGAEFYKNSWLQTGYTRVRKQLPEDEIHPVFSTWGLAVISIKAEKAFVKTLRVQS